MQLTLNRLLIVQCFKFMFCSAFALIFTVALLWAFVQTFESMQCHFYCTVSLSALVRGSENSLRQLFVSLSKTDDPPNAAGWLNYHVARVHLYNRYVFIRGPPNWWTLRCGESAKENSRCGKAVVDKDCVGLCTVSMQQPASCETRVRVPCHARDIAAVAAAAESAIVTTTMMMLTMITLSRWGAEYERVCLSRVYPFAHLGNYTF